MLCKKCNIVMAVTGTRYEQKKRQNGCNKFLHKPYCECKNCGYRKYTNSSNFQEMLKMNGR